MKSRTKKIVGVGFISLMVVGVFAGLIMNAFSYTDVTVRVTYHGRDISLWGQQAQVRLIDPSGHYVQNSGQTSGGSITFLHVPNGQYIVSIKWLVNQNFTRSINGGSQTILIDLD